MRVLNFEQPLYASTGVTPLPRALLKERFEPLKGQGLERLETLNLNTQPSTLNPTRNLTIYPNRGCR